MGRTCGVITLLSLFTSSVIYRIWFKRTSTKTSEEGGLVNFPFPLEVIFCLPPSTYVPAELESFHERRFDTFPQGNLQGGGVIFWRIEIPTTLEKMGSGPILEHVLPEHNVINVEVTPNVQKIREQMSGTME